MDSSFIVAGCSVGRCTSRSLLSRSTSSRSACALVARSASTARRTMSAFTTVLLRVTTARSNWLPGRQEIWWYDAMRSRDAEQVGRVVGGAPARRGRAADRLVFLAHHVVEQVAEPDGVAADRGVGPQGCSVGGAGRGGGRDGEGCGHGDQGELVHLSILRICPVSAAGWSWSSSGRSC